MNRVVKVQPIQKYLLELTFSDGYQKIVDLSPYIDTGLSAALTEDDYFWKVAIESGGGIFWPNGYDFCPNFLRDEVPAIKLAQA
jgi:hypothetical protein